MELALYPGLERYEFFMIMRNAEAIEWHPSIEELLQPITFRALDDDRNGMITSSEYEDSLFYIPFNTLSQHHIARFDQFFGVKGLGMYLIVIVDILHCCCQIK